MKIRYHGQRPSACAPCPVHKMGRPKVLPRAGALALAIVLSGCAHTVPSGIEAAQRGLGAVDLGTDAATEVYVQAADLCARNKAVPGCDRIGDPAEVLRKAEALGEAYDATAEGLDAMQRAYNELAPHFEAAAEVVKGAGLFSR